MVEKVVAGKVAVADWRPAEESQWQAVAATKQEVAWGEAGLAVDWGLAVREAVEKVVVGWVATGWVVVGWVEAEKEAAG